MNGLGVMLHRTAAHRFGRPYLRAARLRMSGMPTLAAPAASVLHVRRTDCQPYAQCTTFSSWWRIELSAVGECLAIAFIILQPATTLDICNS